jgi:hypothetical protein
LDSRLFQATFGAAPIDWRAGLDGVLREVLMPEGAGGKT